jgi:hypothetical protein
MSDIAKPEAALMLHIVEVWHDSLFPARSIEYRIAVLLTLVNWEC